MSLAVPNKSLTSAPALRELIRQERGRIVAEVLSSGSRKCRGLSTLLEDLVEMRLEGCEHFVEGDVLQRQARQGNQTGSQRDNLRRLRKQVIAFYSSAAWQSKVRIAFDNPRYPFVPTFYQDCLDPKPAYQGALVLGEQRTEAGIISAINQLRMLREQEAGITAWGAVGLADMYSRKASYVSLVADCAADVEQAHYYADEAIRTMPAAISYARKGLLCTDDHNLEQASKCFNVAKELDPDRTRLSYEYVTFLAATGNFPDAIARSTEAIARNEERRMHSINLGEIYYMAGQISHAQEQLERAEWEYPDAWVAVALQGVIEFTLGNWSRAVKHFDRASGLPRLGRLRSILLGAKQLTQAVVDHQSIGTMKMGRLTGVRLAEFAVFYVAVGRLSECLAVLETLLSCRYPSMSCMHHWPIFRPLHSNSRFQMISQLWSTDAQRQRR